MKIFYDGIMLKEKYSSQMIKQFPDIQFESDLKKGLDAEAILAMPGFLKKENLDQFKNLKWVQVLTAGFDTIDLEYFKSRNIIFTNAKDVFSIQIAEDVFSKILYFNRHIRKHIDHMTKEEWQYEPVHHEIANSTVGILGTGSIGSEIAKRMKAFDARVIGYKSKPSELPYFDTIYHDLKGLNQLYQQSDYIIVALPLNQSTYHFIGKEAFEMMKDQVVFINIARGDIVDQEALIHAIKQQKVRGAGLDVMSPEPLPQDNELWKMEEVLITPHNSSSSPHVNQRLMTAVIDSILCYKTDKKFKNRII
ncbi:MAG: D-2-hydroxyacid dehydrogenase [Acholeplasmataceae bacterium]|nr:D-2-hydroxyacid dehydrogenase [Acholeplasmataceae bacterium]